MEEERPVLTVKADVHSLLDQWGDGLNYAKAKQEGLETTNATFRGYKSQWRKDRGQAAAHRGRIPAEQTYESAPAEATTAQSQGSKGYKVRRTAPATPESALTRGRGTLDLTKGTMSVSLTLPATIYFYYRGDLLRGFSGDFSEWMNQCVTYLHELLGLEMLYVLDDLNFGEKVPRS